MIVHQGEPDNVCPYCGDTLPEKKSNRLTQALAKIRADLRQQQEQMQAEKQAEKLDRHGTGPGLPISVDSVDLTESSTSIDPPPPPTPPPSSKSIPRPRPKRREPKAAIVLEDDSDEEKRRRASEQADYDPFGSPPPPPPTFSSSSIMSSPTKDENNKKVSIMERFEFCRVHIAEEQIVPRGIGLHYPLDIDFSALEGRVGKMERELKGIVEGTVQSAFLNKALSNYERMGTIGARHPLFVLAEVERTLVS